MLKKTALFWNDGFPNDNDNSNCNKSKNKNNHDRDNNDNSNLITPPQLVAAKHGYAAHPVAGKAWLCLLVHLVESKLLLLLLEI